MTKQLDINFRFRPLLSTPDGILLNYLKKQETSIISHEMILKALRAFWLPEAYQESGKKKRQELKKLAQNMILVLEEQANYLRTVFDIERQGISPVPVQMMSQVPVPMMQMRQIQSPLPEEEVISHELENDVWQSVQTFDPGGL
ncbi:MAG TPA: hypothetical protein DCL61_29565 [Cyanobacteria bacterium UBA12227]|nr:hypothetical protein [Cyanobacteria bacterium UBA12227]HAX89171.1 hypothetical protein [Cyanobacteria bacterium UBA11370]